MADPLDIPGAVTADDAEVQRALEVWDNLTPDEQRETFRTLYEGVAASGRTRDVDPLLRAAESVRGMVRLESQHPEVREAVRSAAARRRPVDPAAGADLGAVVKELREA
jgi:hypothetical protein